MRPAATFAATFAATLAACAPALAAGWSVDRHADLAVAGRVDHVAMAADPSSGGEVLLQCVRDARASYVSVEDPLNAFHNKGEGATVYVQAPGATAVRYSGTVVAKRDGRVVFGIEDAGFAGEFSDGEERILVNTPYVHYLVVLQLAGTEAALAPVRACRG